VQAPVHRTSGTSAASFQSSRRISHSTDHAGSASQTASFQSLSRTKSATTPSLVSSKGCARACVCVCVCMCVRASSKMTRRRNTPSSPAICRRAGWPMDPRNARRRPGRRTEFTLRDTPLTLRGKAAARAGVSLNEFDNYADPDSPTHTALLAESADSSLKLQDDTSLLEESAFALAEVPTDSHKKALAQRIASGVGHARSWGPELESGTFEGAVFAALTPAERTLYDQGACPLQASIHLRLWFVRRRSAQPALSVCRRVRSSAS
jgi:hypothetical protein